MIYFFRRGAESLSCETRLSPTGDGYELLVTEHGKEHSESFKMIADMLAREHELLQAWRAQGWQDVGSPAKKRTGASPEF